MIRLIFLFLLPYSAQAAGGSSSVGKWQLLNNNTQVPCIMMNAQIDLILSYNINGTGAKKDVTIHVPTNSAVNMTKSSCSTNVSIANSIIESQTLQLDLYPDNSGWSGWSLRFYFTTDKRIPTDGGKQWALYKVDVTANYLSDPTHFPNPSEPINLYTNEVILGGDNEFAEYIYAPLNNSLYCPSKQKYMINDDENKGSLASIVFSALSLQSYVKAVGNTDLTKFGPKSICPADQHTTDKVPIIVGGSLAGLIVLTMVLYLVYRACLPQEVIHLTNPHSHHENKAMTWEEEESEHHGSHSNHHGSSLHL